MAIRINQQVAEIGVKQSTASGGNTRANQEIAEIAVKQLASSGGNVRVSQEVMLIWEPLFGSLVTAVFIYPTGLPVAFGKYEWSLSADAIELGNKCIVPQIVAGTLDANGSMNCILVFNDQMVSAQGQTHYQLTVVDRPGRLVWNEIYRLTGVSANLTLLSPSGY